MKTFAQHTNMLECKDHKFSVTNPYLWAIALLVEGLASERAEVPNWDNKADPRANMSHVGSYVVRHDES